MTKKTQPIAPNASDVDAALAALLASAQEECASTVHTGKGKPKIRRSVDLFQSKGIRLVGIYHERREGRVGNRDGGPFADAYRYDVVDADGTILYTSRMWGTSTKGNPLASIETETIRAFHAATGTILPQTPRALLRAAIGR